MKVQEMYKCWQIDRSENEENTEFDKHKSNDKYIFFFLRFYQLKLNRSLNFGEKIRSLIYLVSITKKKLC